MHIAEQGSTAGEKSSYRFRHGQGGCTHCPMPEAQRHSVAFGQGTVTQEELEGKWNHGRMLV